jgi:hypothetical protein
VPECSPAALPALLGIEALGVVAGMTSVARPVLDRTMGGDESGSVRAMRVRRRTPRPRPGWPDRRAPSPWTTPPTGPEERAT